jgi:hypothetical protein
MCKGCLYFRASCLSSIKVDFIRSNSTLNASIFSSLNTALMAPHVRVVRLDEEHLAVRLFVISSNDSTCLVPDMISPYINFGMPLTTHTRIKVFNSNQVDCVSKDTRRLARGKLLTTA